MLSFTADNMEKLSYRKSNSETCSRCHLLGSRMKRSSAADFVPDCVRFCFAMMFVSLYIYSGLKRVFRVFGLILVW